MDQRSCESDSSLQKQKSGLQPMAFQPLLDECTSKYLDHLPDMAWLINEQGILVYANHSFQSYFKLTAASIGVNIQSIIPPAVYQKFYDLHVTVLAKEQTIETTQHLCWADGSDVNCSITLFFMGDNNQRLVGGRAMNTIGRNAYDQELKEANERLLLLSRTTTDAIWEWDIPTGRIFRNDVLMNMIGYQHTASKGLIWLCRSMHPADRRRVWKNIKQAINGRKPEWESEYRFKNADGCFRHIRDHGYIIYENDIAVKMIGSLHDISAYKELKKELVREKLQRQRETSETIIRVQEQERTRIGRELHDNVNQIITSARLFVATMQPKNGHDQKCRQKSMDYLQQAIDEIRKLSHDLVEPAFVENDLLASISQLLEDINLSGDVDFHFEHDEFANLLSPGKKVAIFRILQEQIKNIISYSKATKACIGLHRCQQDIVLSIKDNGIGFEKDKTRRGIGLTNIYERSRFYNAMVQIDTAPGNGCIIKVRMPGLI